MPTNRNIPNYFARPSVQRPDPVIQQPVNQQGRIGDTVDAFQAGAWSAAGGMFDFLGAEKIAQRFYGYAEDNRQEMSERGQTAMERPFFTEDDQGELGIGEGLTSFDTWLLTIANVAGQFAPTAIPGAGAASAVTRTANLGQTGSRAAQIGAMGATGGSAATGQGMNEAREEVLNMPNELLAESQLFRDLFREVYQATPDATNQERWDKAKRALAAQVAREVQTDPAVLAANFGASAIGDPIIGRALMGARIAKKGAFRSALHGFAIESATESFQAGVQEHGINRALQPIDGRDPMDGVRLAALNEGLAGGGFGLVAGGFGGAINRQPGQPAPNQTEQAPDPAVEAIKATNPVLGQELEQMDASIQQGAADIEAAVSGLEAQSQNLDIPTAARNAGFGDTPQDVGRFGDMLTSPVQQALSEMRRQTVASMVAEALGSTAPTDLDRFSPARYQFEGDLIPANRQQPAGLLEGLIVDGEQAQFLPDNRIDGEYFQGIKTEPQQPRLPQKDIIFAGDNRPAQQAQERADAAMRNARNQPARIPQKDIIFASNETGVTVKRNGKPFQSPKEALASKSARDAKKAGNQIEAVPFADGYGWQVAAPSISEQAANISQATDTNVGTTLSDQAAVTQNPETDAAPQAAQDAQAMPAIQGKKARTYTPASNKPIDVEYRVVEADSLVTSNDFAGAVNPNYPAEMQPRNRSRQAYQVQVDNIAKNPIADKLLESPDTDRGAPVVRNGIVESGNGRSIGLREAYRTGKAEQYKQALIERAEQLGLDPQQLAAMQQPVLVRERLTELSPAELREFTVDSNQSAGVEQSPAELAKSDASLITDELIGQLALPENGDVLSAMNDRFIRGFASTLGNNEVASYKQADGQWNKAFKDRVQNAIFAKGYDNADLLNSISESTNPESKNLLTALMNVAGKLGTIRAMDADIGKSLSDAFSEAAGMVTKAKREGTTVAAVDAQADMLTGHTDADIVALAEALEGNIRSGKKMTALLVDISSTVLTETQNMGQTDIFTGEPGARPNVNEVIRNAARKQQQPDNAGTPGLFDGAQNQEANPAEQQRVQEDPGQRQSESRPSEVSQQAEPDTNQTPADAGVSVSDARGFDIRGYSWAIASNDGGVIASGSQPALAAKSETNTLGYLMDYSDRVGGDLYLAPTNLKDFNPIDTSNLIMGMTWDQLNAKQQGTPLPSAIKSKMPSGAVKVYANGKLVGDSLSSQDASAESKAQEIQTLGQSIKDAIGSYAKRTQLEKRVLALVNEVKAADGNWFMVQQNLLDGRYPADIDTGINEALNTLAPQKAESKAAESQPLTDDAVDTHVEAMKAVRDGTATVEQYRASFIAIADNKESVIADLNKRTIKQLLKAGGGMFEYRNRGEKKSDVVDAFYDEMLREYSLDRSYGPSTFYGSSQGIADHRTAKFKALRELVNNTTNDDLDAFAAEVKRVRDEFAADRAAKKSALENPQTLRDFNGLMRSKMEDGMSFQEAFLSLTPDQRITYDELAAEVTKEARDSAKREAKTVIKTAGQQTTGSILETKHTKTGDDLFVVKLDDRLSPEDYRTVLASAKKMGGWYSRYNAGGAVPGFQFKNRSAAEAFLSLAQGDSTQAEQQVNVARDAFEDDKSQSAAERLTTMANKLDERAEEELSRPRLANTDRRARFAAAADASARRDQALAATMRNIAKAISSGSAKFLDAVRQKTQIEYLQQLLNVARYDEVSTKYKDYREQEAQRGSPATVETVDFVKFPSYTAYRSDLASLGRQLLEVDGLKKYGKRIMDVADDVTDAYMDFAKENLYQVATFTKQNKDGSKADFAVFSSKPAAEAAIRRSGYRGKAIVLPVKRGENVVIMSPSEAMNRGIWKGDGDKRITLKADFGNDLVSAIGRKMRGRDGIKLPWQFESAHESLGKLSRMGIQTPAELRSALRELVGLQENAKAPDKVKQMERQMVGRANDDLDFFPTPEGIAQQMLEAAEIQEGMRVLEPSAGMGHIAESVRSVGVDPDVVEFSPSRRELLELKGFNVVGNDFMAVTDGGYDRIIMNPPFSKRRDAEHVQHAYELLNPGGRIVAIMGEGVFFGQDKKAEQFREWLDSVGGYSEKLPENTFMDKSLPVTTGVNTRMVVIDKPANSESLRFSKLKQDAFKRWFGNSKAVDASGEPLVVYHGSPDVRGIIDGGFKQSMLRGDVYFFTDSEAVANTYADASRAWDYQNAEDNVLPVYLSMQNPLIIDAKGQKWRDTEKYIKQAKDGGHDGIIIKNSRDEYNNTRGGGRQSTVYAVFKPTQVKSAASGELRSRVDGVSLGNIANNGNYDPDNADIRFAFENSFGVKPAKGVPVSVAQREADKFVSSLSGAAGIKVVVLPTQKDAEQMWRMSLDGDFVRGAYSDKTGTVYIIAENARSMTDLRQTIAHEVFAHGGLDKVIGADKKQQFLDRIKKTRSNSTFAGLWKQIDRDYDGMSEDVKAEELFAYFVQNQPTKGPIKFWWNAFKRWLNSVLATVGLTKKGNPDIDLMDSMMESIMFGFQFGRRADATAEGDMAFSREGDITDTEAFKKWFGDSKVVDEDGKPLVVYHGSNNEFDAFDPSKSEDMGMHFGTEDQARTFTKGEPRGFYLKIDNMLELDFDPTVMPGDYDFGGNYFDGMLKEIAYELGIYDVMDGIRSGNEALEAAYDAAEVVDSKVDEMIESDADIRDVRQAKELKAYWKAVQGFIQSQGYDGYSYRNELEGEGTSYAVFDPEQIKSATDNSGDFDSTNPDIRFSKSKVEPDTRTAEEKIGQGAKPASDSISDLMKAAIDGAKKDSFWNRMAEGLFDGLHGIKVAETKAGIKDPNKMGYVSARLATGLGDMLHALFSKGALEWRDGVTSIKKDTKGLLEVFGMLPEGDGLNNWLAWMAANRAERLMAEGRERNLTAEDIAQLKAKAKGNEALFEQVRKEYNKINSATLDLAQEAGLLTAEQRAGFDEEWYVPFFREDTPENPDLADVIRMINKPFTTKTGIVGQSANIKALIGGKQSTQDLLQNIIHRQVTMIDASVKNNAAREVARNLAGTDYMTRVNDPEIDAAIDKMGITRDELAKRHQKVKVMEDGKPVYYFVHDAALLRGLMQVHDVGSKALFNKMARSAKRFLTTGVTLSPDFIIRNFIRDAAHAWMVNKDGAKLGTDTWTGLRDSWTGVEGYWDLIASGAAFQGGYIHGADPEAAQQQIRRALRSKGLSTKDVDGYMATVVTSKDKLLQAFEKYRQMSDKLENSNRMTVYNRAIEAGKSQRQALFESKDLMDYSLKGNFGLMSNLIDMLPFFNARMQGLYKLGRAAVAEGGKDELFKVLSRDLAMKGMKVAAFSVALAMLNGDDERYKELAEWDKDAHWHFFFGDEHLRVPKPFELGIIFGTLPERMFNFAAGNQTGKDARESVGHAVFNTLALNPTPQLIMPVVEVLANRSMFTGAPIESMADQNLQKADRYNMNTSDTARAIGKVTALAGISPKQVQHLITGYTGTLGAYTLTMSDFMARAMTGRNKADTPVADWPIMRTLYQGGKVQRNTMYQQRFIESLQKAQQAYGSFKLAVDEQDPEKARRIFEKRATELNARLPLQRTQRQVGEINKQMRLIDRNPNLSGKEKREQMDLLQRRKNELYEQAYMRLELRNW